MKLVYSTYPENPETLNKRVLNGLSTQELNRLISGIITTKGLPKITLPSEEETLQAYITNLPAKELKSVKKTVSDKVTKWIKYHNKICKENQENPLRQQFIGTFRYLIRNFYSALERGELIDNSFQFSPSASGFYLDCYRHTPRRHVQRLQAVGLLTVWDSPHAFRNNRMIRLADWIIDELILVARQTLEKIQAPEQSAPKPKPEIRDPNLYNPYYQPESPQQPPLEPRKFNPFASPTQPKTMHQEQPQAPAERPEIKPEIAQIKGMFGFDINEEALDALNQFALKSPKVEAEQRISNMLNNFKSNMKPK